MFGILKTWGKLGVVLPLLLSAQVSRSQSAVDYTVRVTATIQTNPAQIILSWPADPNATGYTVNRKGRDSTVWTGNTSLPGSATSYTNPTASIGSGYEFRVVKTTASYTGYGYIYSGIHLPMVDARGKVILLVDNTFSSTLATELDRLQLDLAGDGWTVVRHDVPRNDPVTAVKNLILADYAADPGNVRTVFLLGHVPVPYSGDFAIDGHPDHDGAWPADAYYGDVDGEWTDVQVNNSSASLARNRNVPGDGKFDQTFLPSPVELQVGRVDFFNLPSFGQTETDLMRQYLAKSHAFRHKQISVPRRAMVDDHFGAFNGEAFAANGWRTFAPLVGAGNTTAGDWLTTLKTEPHLWAYGCGGGSYTSAGGIATTADLTQSDLKVVFTMVFGSYFGDWDSQDNFLRAHLAMPTYTLAAAWGGRPYWLFHHLGMGEPLGFSARVTQNNLSVYAANYGTNLVHISLLGDPTLRLHPVSPPSALTASREPDSPGTVTLNWQPSAEPVVGYHVYRAPTIAGPFARLTTSLITTTSYTDPLVSSNVYMVRAVKLEQSPSGSYLNPSQGIFQSLDPAVAAPSVTLLQPAGTTTNIWPGFIRIAARTVDPGLTITNVFATVNGTKMANMLPPACTTFWTNPPVGIHTIQVQAACQNGTTVSSAVATVTVDNGGRPRLEIVTLGQGTNRISGLESLGRVYRLQYLDHGVPGWNSLGDTSPNSSNSFFFLDTTATGQRSYRTVYP